MTGGGCKYVTLAIQKRILAASAACGPLFAFYCWLLAELKQKPSKKLGSSFFMSTSRSLFFLLCGSQLSLFGFGRGRFINVQVVRNECHGLKKVLSNEYREGKRRTLCPLRKSGCVVLTQHACIATVSDKSFVLASQPS